jgi:hypothetical protein
LLESADRERERVARHRRAKGTRRDGPEKVVVLCREPQTLAGLRGPDRRAIVEAVKS